MSYKNKKVEKMKKETSFLLFIISQSFFYSFIIECLILIIIKNSINIKKAKVDKIKKTIEKKKHVV